MRLSHQIPHDPYKSGELVMATIEDEYRGQGGSYLLDPKTGIRKLVERTEPAQPSDTTPEDLSNGTDRQEDVHPQQS